MRTFKILHIEDEPEILEFVADLLYNTDTIKFEITGACSISESIEILGSEQFDIIFLDLTLSDSKGMNTFNSLNNFSGNTPIVIISGIDDEKLAAEIVGRGAKNYLVKQKLSRNLLINMVIFSMEEPAPQAINKAKVLIAEDSKVNMLVAKEFALRLGYEVIEAVDGVEALYEMKHSKPDIVFLDLIMPKMSGVQLLHKVKNDIELNKIPIVVLTSVEKTEVIAECIECGASDYMIKPISFAVMKARTANLIKIREYQEENLNNKINLEIYNRILEQKIADQVSKLTKAQLSTIFALSNLAESRDPETGKHLKRLSSFSEVLGIALSMNPDYKAFLTRDMISLISKASPLHDIGKVGIPDSILLKPGKLTEEEFNIMKTHTTIGGKSLRNVSFAHPDNEYIQMGITIAETHHEKWDGTGYPKGLKGHLIPIPGRILALCDVYDALTSRRVYKEPFSHKKSKEIILNEKGKLFDPEVVEAFLIVEEEFDTIREKYADTKEDIEGKIAK